MIDVSTLEWEFCCVKEMGSLTWPGEHLHGLLFSWAADLASPLGKQLHSGDIRPFRLAFHHTQGPDGIKRLRVRMFSLTQPATNLMAILARLRPGHEAMIGASRYQLVSRSTPTGLSYDDLASGSPGPPHFTFHFQSPTSFRSRGTQQLFPDPERVFTSLMRRWNAFAPVKLPVELSQEWAGVRVSRYRLETQVMQMSGFKLIGFTGEVSYQCPASMPLPIRHALGCLVRFAPYAGVGYGTAKGLGDVWVSGGGAPMRREVPVSDEITKPN